VQSILCATVTFFLCGGRRCVRESVVALHGAKHTKTHAFAEGTHTQFWSVAHSQYYSVSLTSRALASLPSSRAHTPKHTNTTQKTAAMPPSAGEVRALFRQFLRVGRTFPNYNIKQ
jgi:hypothetical protein